MPTLGPVVVVTETSATELVDVLGKAGAFPIVESKLSAAPSAIAEIKPIALLLADPLADANADDVQALERRLTRIEEGLGIEPEGLSASGWVADLRRLKAEVAKLRKP